MEVKEKRQGLRSERETQVLLEVCKVVQQSGISSQLSFMAAPILSLLMRINLSARLLCKLNPGFSESVERLILFQCQIARTHFIASSLFADCRQNPEAHLCRDVTQHPSPTAKFSCCKQS